MRRRGITQRRAAHAARAITVRAAREARAATEPVTAARPGVFEHRVAVGARVARVDRREGGARAASAASAARTTATSARATAAARAAAMETIRAGTSGRPRTRACASDRRAQPWRTDPLSRHTGRQRRDVATEAIAGAGIAHEPGVGSAAAASATLTARRAPSAVEALQRAGVRTRPRACQGDCQSADHRRRCDRSPPSKSHVVLTQQAAPPSFHCGDHAKRYGRHSVVRTQPS